MKIIHLTVKEPRFCGSFSFLSWEQRKLGEVVSVYDGVHQTPDYKDSGIMFLSVENISTLKSEKYISKEAFKKDYKVYPQKGDILMTRIGDVGTPNVVETSEKVAFYVSLALLKPNGINSYFLCNAIQSPLFQKGLKDRTLVTAIPQKINKDEIGKVNLILPTSKEEQKQIGEYFRNLDRLITLHQCKATLEKAIQEILFTIEKIKKSTCSWEQRKFEDVVLQITTGLNPRDNFTLNSGGKNYYVTIKNFEHGVLHLDDKCDLVDDDALSLIQARSDLKKDDILFTSIGRVGDCFLIKNTPNNWNINESVFSLRPNKNVANPEYLFHTIHSDIVLNQILNNITGSTFKSIKIGDLKNVIVPIPTKNEQAQIANFITVLESLITLHQRIKIKITGE